MAEENKEENKRNDEPRINELEDMVSDFRERFGIETLMSFFSHEEKPKNQEFPASHPENNKDEVRKSTADPETIEHHTEKENEAGSNHEHFIYPKTNSANTGNDDQNKSNLKKIAIPKISKPKLPHGIWSKKRYRYPILTFLVFGLIYLLFNLPVFYARYTYTPPQTVKTVVTTQEVVQKKMADSAVLLPGETIPLQSTISIPKINVTAPIIFVESRSENDIQKGLEKGIVHYQGTASPGKIGNSFLTGHSSNYWWSPGKYNYVFVNLDKLTAGDTFTVYDNGKKFVYTVREKVVVEPTEVSVLAPTDTPTMSLMTCTPPGTSWKRLVVKADLTEPVYYKPETVTKETIVEKPLPKQDRERSLLEKILSFFIPN